MGVTLDREYKSINNAIDNLEVFQMNLLYEIQKGFIIKFYAPKYNERLNSLKKFIDNS